MTAPTTPPETTSERPEATTIARTEVLVAGLLVVIAVAFTAYAARDTWFTHDEWEYVLRRTAFDPDSLLRPFGGHWTSWSTLLLRGLFNTVGLDFWPWYYLPKLVGHTGLAIAIWLVARRRGADPVVALVALAGLLVLDASFYQRALQVGNWVVYLALILCALVIDRRPDNPATGDRVIVAATLLLAALGNGYAVAVIGGITVALLVTRRIVAWIPSLVPVIVVYGAWYLHYRGDLKRRPETVSAVLDMPLGVFRLLRTAIGSATGLPTWVAGIGVVALVAWIVLLAVRRRFDLFDTIVLSTLIVGLVLLNLQRIAYEPGAALRNRYSYSIIVLLVLLLVPHIPHLRSRAATAVALVIGAAVVVANANGFQEGLEDRNEIGRRSALVARAAFELIDAGEPIVATDPVILPGINATDLAALAENGDQLDPLPADHPDRDAALAEARGALRMEVIQKTSVAELRTSFAEGPSPTTDARLDADGCAVVGESDPVSVTVTAPALLTVEKERRGQGFDLTWIDDAGTGRQLVVNYLTRAVIALADPSGTASLTMSSEDGDAVVCGLEPADGAAAAD